MAALRLEKVEKCAVEDQSDQNADKAAEDESADFFLFFGVPPGVASDD